MVNIITHDYLVLFAQLNNFSYKQKTQQRTTIMKQTGAARLQMNRSCVFIQQLHKNQNKQFLCKASISVSLNDEQCFYGTVKTITHYSQ